MPLYRYTTEFNANSKADAFNRIRMSNISGLVSPPMGNTRISEVRGPRPRIECWLSKDGDFWGGNFKSHATARRVMAAEKRIDRQHKEKHVYAIVDSVHANV